MDEKDVERIKKIKDDKEMLDIVEKIINLQSQIENPDRNGMISSLQDAQQIACDKIVQNMYHQSGYVYSKAWSDFSNDELYNMLPKYQQGLIDHGISKIGRGEFEKLLKIIIQKVSGKSEV